MFSKLCTKVRKLFREEEGVVMSEYAMLLGLIALALITAVGALATAIAAKFSAATTTLNNAP
jgi:Flp pilus assembly pilin Flp